MRSMSSPDSPGRNNERAVGMVVPRPATGSPELPTKSHPSTAQVTIERNSRTGPSTPSGEFHLKYRKSPAGQMP